MRIFLETSKEGIRITMDVDPKDRVYQLKKKVSLRDATTSQLKFFFQGKELNPRTTLKENQICQDSSIILKLTEASKPIQRGRNPKGGGGSGFSVLPLSWWWVVIIGVIAIAVSYRDAIMRAPVIDPVVIDPLIPPVPVPVSNVIASQPSIPEYEEDEEEQNIMICTLAIQWPKSHVLDKGFDSIQMQLVPHRSVLHGLWPDVKIAGPSLPFDCSMVVNDDELLRSASRNWPNLDPRHQGVELIDHNCKFWAKEWDKHGVHSGLTQEVYMKLALVLFHRVAPTLDGVLQDAIDASSSSSKHHASSSGKCEAQDLQDFVLPKRKHRKSEVYLNIRRLEYALAENIEKPKVLCRTPPGKKMIFHSVNLKVRIKIPKSSASALPSHQFLPYPADKQCDDMVILP